MKNNFFIEEIEKNIDKEIKLFSFDTIDSTNSEARRIVTSKNAPDRGLVISNHQSAGRGRTGHSFYSPEDTGIYMSYFFKPENDLSHAHRSTTMAAVAVRNVLSRYCEDEVYIKWVNDLYLNGRKICGILTEAVPLSVNHGYVIVGIGINLSTDNFPDDIKEVAGSLTKGASSSLPSRETIISEIISNLSVMTADLQGNSYVSDYRKYSMLANCDITYQEKGVKKSATVIGIDDECRLMVRNADGTCEALDSGEVSLVRINQ